MKALVAAALLALAGLPAHALYKVVGPDGKVTYTDRPPAASQGRATPLNRDAGGSGDVALPLVLREAMTRFPVVLYSASDCQPCDAGRELLRQRGVPFQERAAANTAADQDALLKLTGSAEAPALSIGGQVLRGFSPEVWSNYLDTAGYPRDSRLPANYVAPPQQPLVAQQPPRPAAPAAREGAAPAPTPLPEPAPGGIRF